MSRILVKKSAPLKGEIKVSGSKNAVLPLMAATLLTEEECVIGQVPNLRDTRVMSDLIASFGAASHFDIPAGTLTVKAERITSVEPDSTLVAKMRASIVTMGPILARTGKAMFPLPGGCNIGERPIDLHLKGFTALGAHVVIDNDAGYVLAEAEELIGATIYLDSPSVGATENIMMAAALAKGTTYIENAAQEPEIIDLARFLNMMGAKIRNAGDDTIRIDGVEQLHGASHEVIPDRIEAATYMLISAVSCGDVTITNMEPSHVKAITAKIRETGVKVDEFDDSVRVYIEEGDCNQRKTTEIRTMPYPGFPTDAQPQFMAYLSTIDGQSHFLETVFENRYMHVAELNKLGANIIDTDRKAVVTGVETLHGAEVRATDLRAGAALIIAGVVAEGETYISDIYHVERGYDDIIGKLRGIGANISLVD
ncbi:MAG: UDP-N-acetylglucosamine 1-carboxyvinyltransferase [Clostridiales Family XIII bacterium]|jgi:UDP-N-acetylglucosamine 1-carboxyvinyltransferase|nr:UDP-N-acetylglucosamine 1-carboxyvinyltransferase [Clostridiales Family XIII bacterium]